MQSSYKAGESVTFTWDSTSNTTHYNLWLARSIGNDKWENVEQVFYADNGMTRTFEAGEYRVQLLSYNSDLWETDHSDWVHTWSDDYFFTVEEPVLDSGTCGDNGSNVTWKLTEDGILTISGTGAMIDYGDDKSYRKTPWRDYFIESVRIDEGVTSIGGWAFTNCVLTSVMIPDSVTSIACGAFSECRSLASVTIPDSVTSIDGYAFSGCDSLTDVYYAGTAADWAKISISEGNEDLTSAALRCAPASLSAPSVTGGNDSQGRPMLKWNAVSGAAKYEVYRARSKNGDYIKYSTVTGTNYTNTSYIENGNTYYYKVRALDANGTAGPWSDVVAVTCRLGLTAPSVTGGNDSQGRPTLKWNAVTGAAKYEVYRARSKDGDYIKYSTVTGTSYTNISYIENGNTYYYKVRALDANGTAGPWSDVVAVTCRLGLTAPSVTGGNDSQGRPTLKWNAVTGAAKYELYRARSKDGDYIKYSTQTSTGYTNSAYLTSGSTYYYKVRALDANGTAGPWSDVVAVTCRLGLTAPTVTGGNDAQGRPTLKWNAVSGAAKYEVYRARSKDGDYIKYSTTTGTSYTNISYIENGNTYYYKVRALDANGTAGAWSSIVSVTYKQTLPAPTVTGGNDAQGRPTLTWKAVTGAAKYEVYRARSMNGDYIKYSTVTGTSYTNTSYIENGTTYYYKVRALDANGTAGPWSDVVAVTCRLGLTAPSVTGGNDSQGRPTLKWDKVAGAAKYEVYRARSLNGDYIKYSTVTGTSYTNISYIENGNTYYYKVRALGSDGTAGAWSSVVSVTYKQTLSAPSVTGGNDSQGRPTLKWNAVTGAAKYEVYRARSKDGDYIKYSTVTGTSYTNTSYIENGNTYYYKVRALKSDGTAGAWSSIVSVTYRAASTGTLSAPTVTGGNDAQGRPTLTWKAVSGAAKYEVYRARSRSGEYIKYSTVTGTSYTNTSYIENGNTYYYKVRALKSDGTAGAWSSIVSVTYRKPAATVASGKCGDRAEWALDAAGTLTISGSGRMYDYEWPADRGGTTPPWLANKYRDSIRALRVEQGITYIGRCAFDSCSNLSDVTLPTSLRIIGQCAFNDCTALRSIQLPEGLTTIMEDAFNAAGLVSITFPSTLGELRDGAFMNCEKLQSLRLPEGLTTMGNWAFYCNPNISSIYIPASVTTIGEEAFIYYNNLATVRYGGSQSQWSAVSVAANAFPDGVRYVYNAN